MILIGFELIFSVVVIIDETQGSLFKNLFGGGFVLTCPCPTAHLQKLMSDKKCTAEKKAEMEQVTTQVSVSGDSTGSF